MQNSKDSRERKEHYEQFKAQADKDKEWQDKQDYYNQLSKEENVQAQRDLLNMSAHMNDLDVAKEAGLNLQPIPKSIGGKEEAIQVYGEALNEREIITQGNPNEAQRQNELAQLNTFKQEHQQALAEAIYIREVVRRELSDANLHYQKAEPGETYTGRVVGKSNSYVIQSDDSQPGAVVLHERHAISGDVKMNENAEIAYPAGTAGIVRERSRVQPTMQRQTSKGSMERSR